MGRFMGLEWNGMKYGVFFQLCLGLYKRKNGIGGGGGGWNKNTSVPFTFYLSF